MNDITHLKVLFVLSAKLHINLSNPRKGRPVAGYESMMKIYQGRQGHHVKTEKSPTNVEQYTSTRLKKPTAYSSLTTYHYDVTLTECFPKFYSAWVALVLFLDEWLLRLFESYCHQHMKAHEKTKLELLYHHRRSIQNEQLVLLGSWIYFGTSFKIAIASFSFRA